MRPSGVQATIGTDGGSQFEVLGAFWQAMRRQADPARLRGVGHTWDAAGHTFEYLVGIEGDHLWNPEKIALLDGLQTARLGEIALPDDGWQRPLRTDRDRLDVRRDLAGRGFAIRGPEVRGRRDVRD